MEASKPIVVIAVRSESERHGWHHPLLTGWLISLMMEEAYTIRVELVHGLLGYAASSNAAASLFMSEHNLDADWLCIADNDTVPPYNVLRMLDTAPEADIISPLCHMGQQEKIIPQAGTFSVVEGVLTFEPLDPNPPGLYEVDRVGGGCWFIRRRVFEAMEKPYFKVLLHPETFGITVTDDIYFQMQARKLGFRVFCDSRYTASHFHSRDLSL